MAAAAAASECNLDTLFTQTWTIVHDIVASSSPSLDNKDQSIITLAYIDIDGQPSVCSVALRASNSDLHMLEFYSDLDSMKCKSVLRNNTKAQLLIWKAEEAIQLRLSVELRLRHNDRKTESLWETMSQQDRSHYGKRPSTGTPIDGPCAYETLSCKGKFTVVECHLQKIDFLSLREMDFRAQFTKKDKEWIGQWISP